MAAPDIASLRNEVTDAVTALRRRQIMTWDFMMNDVDGASEKFREQRLSLIEERIRILAAGTHPTLLESVIGLIVVAFPFGAVANGLLKHWSRTMEIGKVVGVLGSKVSGPNFMKLMERTSETSLRNKRLPGSVVALRKPRIEFVRETTEYNANLQKFSTLYGNEIATSTRNLVKGAAEKAAKPVVSQDRLFDPKSAEQSHTPVDASDYLKGVRDWIVRAKNVEVAALEDLEKAAARSEDEKQLEAIKTFLSSDLLAERSLRVDYDREAFQRYIEMCLWCTTWDFRPRWIAGSRANPVIGKAMVMPHFEAPPLGDKFWKFACDRYYDPFFGDGAKTYSEIGRNRQMGASAPAPLPADVAAHYGAKAEEVFGQYPSERLAYSWGNIVAPSLLDLNKELGAALERQLRMDTKQVSEPDESDRFYQYLLGIKKVDQ